MANKGITPEEQRLQDLLNLQAAFRNSGQGVPGKLHAEISTLAGATATDQPGSTEERDKQRQRADAQIVGMVSMGVSQEIARSHVSLIENGFQGDKDFFKFGEMLDDKKYWNYLEQNPEERKKVANCFCDGLVNDAVKAGKKSPEQIAAHVEAKKEQMIERSSDPENMRQKLEQLSQEGDLHEKIRAASTAKSTGRSTQVDEILSPVESLVGKDKVDNLVASRSKAEETKSIIAKTGEDFSISQDAQLEAKRAETKEIRTEVLAKAEDMGIKTDRKEFAEAPELSFASILNEPNAKIAANTLKKAQEETKNEPNSKPADVAIAENSKAAENSQDTGTSLA